MSDKKPTQPPWYDLAIVLPYRDLLLIAGFLLTIAGVGVFSHAAALLVAGLGLMAGSWHMSAYVKMRPKPEERKPHVSM